MWLLVAWHVVGCVLLAAAGAWPGARFRSTLHRFATPSGLLGAIACGSLTTVAGLFTLSHALGTSFNAFDDEAYAYLAERLTRTGGLIDSFNQRRLVSYGGATLYHALILNAAGNSALYASELMFSSLMLAFLVAARPNRRFALVGGALLVVGVLAGSGVGPIVNISPCYSAAALTLAAFRVLELVPTRTESRLAQGGAAIVFGLLLGGVIALRFTFATPIVVAAILVLVLELRRGRVAMTSALVAAASTTVAISGWAVALERSSGTPLFPLIDGNYNPSWPGGTDPNASLHSYIRIVIALGREANMGWIIAVSALIAVGLLWWRGRTTTAATVLLAASLGCASQFVVLSVAFSASGLNDLWRFAAPSTFALGLYAIDALWRSNVPRPTARASRPDATTRRDGTGWSFLRGGTVATLVLVISVLMFNAPLSALADQFKAGVHAGANLVTANAPLPDRYSELRATYERVNAAIPRDARVLAAVNYPALLDPTRYTFSTLDIAGSVSPPPHMPFGKGLAAKLTYLREQGYDYILAQDDNTYGLYNRARWAANLTSLRAIVPLANRRWTPDMLEWLDDVTRLSSDPSARRFGGLLLVRIAGGARH